MKIIDKLSEQKQKLDKLKPYSSEAIREFLEDLELKFIYHSNAISGSSITLTETKEVLEGKTIGGKSLTMHLEILNQKAAIDYVVKLAQDKADITQENLKQVNTLILNKIDPKNAGKYVEDDLILDKVNNFFTWYNSNKNKHHPVELAAMLSIELKKIRPFINENGKTIRLILNLELLKNEYPITIIGINGTDECHNALEKAYNTGDYCDYIELLSGYVLKSFSKYFDLIANRRWEDKNYEHEFVL